ncbi:MAG TPA: aspartyl protease family protein [Caulobacteraceae bacterium]|nr:aspartyl protease family protein [Caulobacteraceae bacterium]
MATRRSFLVQLGLLGAGAAAVWLLRDKVVFAPPSVRFAQGSDSGWLPFSSRTGLVTVTATLNGREVHALVDSGAQFSVLDRAFAQSFGPDATYPLPMMAYGVGGAPQVGRGITVDVTVGGLTLDRLRAAVLDLGPLAGGAGVPIPLILGQDMLHALVADIDFPGRRIRFADRETYALPAGAVAAPVRSQGKALLAQVTVEGKPLEVVVDTGASAALSLTTDTAETLGLFDGRPARSAQSVVLGGVTWGRIVEVERVDFAGQTVRDAEVHIFKSQPIPGFPKGLLGQGVLRRHRVVLDHGGGQMHIVGGYVPLTLGPRP